MSHDQDNYITKVNCKQKLKFKKKHTVQHC